MHTRIANSHILILLTAASLLGGCGGGGGMAREDSDMQPPLTTPGDLQQQRQEAAVQDTEEAWIVAEAAARDAEAACVSTNAACTAARDARGAASRAAAALADAQSATTADDAEQAALEAAVAAGDATDAAEVAIRLAADHESMTDSDLTGPFTLAAGTERQLALDIFLVCPTGGTACEIMSVTEDEDGEFQVALAQSSSQAFFWHSGAGLFAATLMGYEEATVRLVGSDRIHRVTCGQAAPCDVSNLHVNEQGRLSWDQTGLLHVSRDETGFFLVGERTVTFPDGTIARFNCPNGCGIDKIFIDTDGTYSYVFDDAWAEPEFELLDEDEDGAGEEEETGSGDEQDSTTESTPTLPVDTASFGDLPVQLTRFKVDHWELSDETPWFTLNPDAGQWEQVPQEEVVCPGIDPKGNECTVRGDLWTVDRVLERMVAFIAVTPNRDPYGYTVFLPDLNKVEAVRDKLLMQQPLTSEDEELLAYNSTGWWGEYSAFGLLGIYHPDDEIPSSVHHFAFGDLYNRDRGGKPTAAQGGATWLGPWAGGWDFSIEDASNNTLNRSAMNGTAKLVYDFALDELDLTLTIDHAEPINSASIQEALDTLPDELLEQAGVDTQSGSTIPYGGPPEIKWENVKQNDDGSFFISGNHREGTAPDSELGILDGDFYGPNAEEFAGYFERSFGLYDLRGAFGGKRPIEN